jgi:hypothetical protein
MGEAQQHLAFQARPVRNRGVVPPRKCAIMEALGNVGVWREA